jgi:hypothetical protein
MMASVKGNPLIFLSYSRRHLEIFTSISLLGGAKPRFFLNIYFD